MSKQIKTTVIRELVEQSITRCEAFLSADVAHTKVNPNWLSHPQVHEMHVKVQGELGAFQAVLSALQGDNVDLGIFAGSNLPKEEV